MSEAIKENLKTPKRSKRKPAMEPLGWDEIVSQPGMGGYLSFLNGPVPLPHLQAPEAAKTPAITSTAPTATAPGVDSGAAATTPASAAIPGVDPIIAIASTPEPALASEVKTATELVPVAEAASTPEVISIAEADPPLAPEIIPGVETMSEDPQGLNQPQDMHQPQSSNSLQGSLGTQVLKSPPHVPATPVVVSLPALPLGAGFERANRIRIRKCLSAQDGHSLGEEVLYQALWKASRPTQDSTSRTITVGWRGMSQLCRMTPKNCKINTQRLLRKLALEILSPYNTPESVGTTYRIYSSDELLERRRTAGLEWVIRSRGVEFVDPSTGNSLSAQVCGNVGD